jgi:hypothetical protein
MLVSELATRGYDYKAKICKLVSIAGLTHTKIMVPSTVIDSWKISQITEQKQMVGDGREKGMLGICSGASKERYC